MQAVRTRGRSGGSSLASFNPAAPGCRLGLVSILSGVARGVGEDSMRRKSGSGSAGKAYPMQLCVTDAHTVFAKPSTPPECITQPADRTGNTARTTRKAPTLLLTIAVEMPAKLIDVGRKYFKMRWFLSCCSRSVSGRRPRPGLQPNCPTVSQREMVLYTHVIILVTRHRQEKNIN